MTGSPRETSSADWVASQLRDLVVTGKLAPGQHIRQEQMAEELGVSRAPLREALKELSSEGLVSHLHNSGYAVARLSRRQFEQIYLLRRLIETEVIMQIPKPPRRVITGLNKINEQVAAASARLDIAAMQLHNRELHFGIFQLSGLELLVAELERLWSWAMPYHIVYLYDSGARERLIREHRNMIRALGAGDNAAVARLMDEHRLGNEQHQNSRLELPAPVSLLG